LQFIGPFDDEAPSQINLPFDDHEALKTAFADCNMDGTGCNILDSVFDNAIDNIAQLIITDPLTRMRDNPDVAGAFAEGYPVIQVPNKKLGSHVSRLIAYGMVTNTDWWYAVELKTQLIGANYLKTKFWKPETPEDMEALTGPHLLVFGGIERSLGELADLKFLGDVTADDLDSTDQDNVV